MDDPQMMLLQIQAQAITDTGGSVVPKQTCEHVFSRFKVSLDDLAQSMGRPCTSCDSWDENWVCLECNDTLCSRYVMGHGVEHWEGTMFAESDMSLGGHCLALSLSDLSVWCYACNEYIKHDRLLPLLIRAEAIKFACEEKVGMLNGVQREFQTGFAYSNETEAHERRNPPCFERPQRATTAWERLMENAVLAKCRPIRVQEATREQLSLVHTAPYLEWLDSLCKDGASAALPADLFANPHTAKAAKLSAGGLLALLEAWRQGTIKNGFALSRPPGHHAGPSSGGGFCFLNNVAVCARVAQRQHGLTRILILDWDIHHGNGTQEVFYGDKGVLVVSIHRQKYKVGESEVKGRGEASGDEALVELEEGGRADRVGSGEAAGFNVNVALYSEDGLGDADYMQVMTSIVLPLIGEYRPELVLVSAGFDAAASDEHLPVGGYRLTPQGYAAMTRTLLQATDGKALFCLEGGYNPTGLAANIEACLGSMLRHSTESQEARHPPPIGQASEQTRRDIGNVKTCLAPYWACLRS